MRVLRELRDKKLNWKDFVLAILCVLLLFFVMKFDMIHVFPLSTTTSVDQAYSAQIAKDGSVYILDSGHERLLHTDQKGHILGQILSSEFGSGYMYIDGFAFDEEEEGGIYLHGSEWDGMYLSQEYLYRFDSKGEYQDCLFSAEYKSAEVNKHRIYGLSASEGVVKYLLLDENEITSVVYDTETGKEKKNVIPYSNAFNAVSDAVQTGDLCYILNKDGIISGINPNAKDLTPVGVWNLSESVRSTVCIPYRLGVNEEGDVYFTDIRGGSVYRVLPGNVEEMICTGTETLTVGIGTGAQKDALVITENDEVRIFRDTEETSISTLVKPSSDIFKMVLFVVLDLLALLALVLVLVRFFFWIFSRGLSNFVKVEIFVVAILLIVSGMVIFVLMQEFSEHYEDRLCSQVESAAYMVATQVDASDIESINTAADFDGEAYGRICDIMQNSYTKDVEFYKDLYCNILRYDGGDAAHAVAYLDQSIGTYFPLDSVESKEVIRVYETGKPVWNGGKKDVTGSYLYAKVPVFDKDGAVKGVVAAGMDISVMNELMGSMIKQVLVALIIIILLIMLAVSEIANYMSARTRYQEDQKRNRLNTLPGHSVRILVFSVFTAYNIASTFLPVYLMRQSASVGLISHELAASLPITVNIFTIGAMSLFCARLVSKMGVRRMAAISGLFSLIGNLLIFTLPYYPAIFAGLLLDGMGVGLISNVLYIMITYVKDPESRREGFTIYNSACLSGINFGMMLGAVLALNFGERNVFGFVVCIWAVVIVLTVGVSRQVEHLLDTSISENELQPGADVPPGLPGTEMAGSSSSMQESSGAVAKPTSREEKAAKKKNGRIGLSAFLRSRGVMSFFVLIQNPYIIFNSFVFYYVPLFCADNGYGETITSLLLMLYALMSVCLGETITGMISERFGGKAMYLACGLNIAAVLTYAWHPGIKTMILALIILGFSASFGKAIQQEYFMEMKPVARYGEDNAMGVYNFTENIGESLGPIVFGRLMFTNPLSLAVSGFGGLIAAMGAAHFLGSRKSAEADAKES